MNRKQKPRNIAAALAIAFTTVSAIAAHASPLTMSVPQVNYPAWTTLEECQSAQPGQGCESAGTICFGFPIYTTALVSKTLAASMQQNNNPVEIYAMNNGPFPQGQLGDLICTIR